MAMTGNASVIHIHSSIDGVVYNLKLLGEGIVVYVVQQEIYGLIGVEPDDQILLFGPPYVRLDPKKSLRSYGLPKSDKQIFLFNRRLLSSDSIPPKSVLLQPQEIEIPSVPVNISSNSRILSESSSPLLRALADYDQQFLLHLTQGQALELGARARLSSCENCIQQQHTLVEALGAALGNLESFENSISRRFKSFYKELEEQCGHHDALLESFESDIEKLSKVKLHQALATSSRKTLLDCIPLERERQWAMDCRESHKHLQSMLKELTSQYEIIQASHEDAQLLQVNQEHLAEIQTLSQKQLAFLKTLEANYKIVVERVQETSVQMRMVDPGSMFGSTNALEACRGLDELWREQGELLPKMMETDQMMKKLLNSCGEDKTQLSLKIHNKLKNISVLQSQIRDLSNMMNMIKEAMVAQRMQFAELEHLEKLPDAYQACLVEIARRRKYGRIVSERIRIIGEELAQFREEEMEKRENFLRDHGQHLPREFVPGLAEKPSHCEIRIRSFDVNLPLIDSDLPSSSSKDEEFPIKSQGGSLLIPANPDWSPLGSEYLLRERCEELEKQVLSLKKSLAEKVELELELDRKQEPKPKQEQEQEEQEQEEQEQEQEQEQSIELDCSIEEEDQEEEEKLQQQQPQQVHSQTEEEEEKQDDDQRSENNQVRSEDENTKKMDTETCTSAATFESSSKEVQQQEEQQKHQEETKSDRDLIDSLTKELELKDSLLSKLQSEQEQAVLNAASFEEDLQQHLTRERHLDEIIGKLEDKIHGLHQSIAVKNASLSNLTALCDLDENWNLDDQDSSKVNSLVNKIESRISMYIQRLKNEALANKSLSLELTSREEIIRQLENEKSLIQQNKISFKSFVVNDLALFLPTSGPGKANDHRIYLAFHLGCPHRYLSDESISSFRQSENRYPDYILGKIVFIDEGVACEIMWQEIPVNTELGQIKFTHLDD